MKNQLTILVIFGISGDLAKRYLLPAIDAMSKGGMLPDKFKLVGITRKETTDNYQMDVTRIEEYEKLNEYLLNIEKEFGAPAERLFYLSVPPGASGSIIEFMGQSSLKTERTKIVLEKPFGRDLSSATELIGQIKKYFNEDQLYCVDHYLTKSSVQNIVTTKWPKDNIAKINIVASEKIGIEGRANFYEQTGALRDFVQSHLLELTALTLLESGAANTPAARLQALQNLAIVCDITYQDCVKRGQYQGYREEVSNEGSMVETFVAINIASRDPQWLGVRIKIGTGKALKEKLTRVSVEYKDGNNKIFNIEHEPDAYQKVLTAVMNGDHNLFISSAEVLETWRILDLVQKSWQGNGGDIYLYPKGSDIYELEGGE